MAAYNAVVYAAATYGTGNAAKRVNILCLLLAFGKMRGAGMRVWQWVKCEI